MSAAQITTALLVESVLARVNNPVIVAVLEARGNRESGAILVRLDAADGTCRLEARHADGEGDYIWHDITGDTPLDAEQAAARIAKERDFDPDLWVIAIDTTLYNKGNPFARDPRSALRASLSHDPFARE